MRILLVLAFFLLLGCSPNPEPGLGFDEWVHTLMDRGRIARLDGPQTRIQTTWDRTGGNNDYNYFPYENPEGWGVVADLKGPGVLTRFWCTGGLHNGRRLRYFFDGEKKPRIDTTMGEMRSGALPFSDLTYYEQGALYTFSPLPFYNRLVIMVDDNGCVRGNAKFYYQYNWLPLSGDKAPASWPRKPNAQTRASLRQFAEDFRAADLREDPERMVAQSLLLRPGGEVVLAMLTGPSVIRTIRITPETFSPKLLRDAVLKIYWDDSPDPSVAVPLGDFFGSVWQRTRYSSRFFGLEGDTFVCRFPMPFKKSARLVLVNEGLEASLFTCQIGSDDVSGLWDDDLGYFHAAWNRSGPQPGTPHPILQTAGRGKYVGCILSATSFDRSWWLLESDEYMIRDGEPKPCWHGTGLEDYFNGGWYYKNVIARPLHGLVFKAPYRTVQYRLHDLDAVHFDQKMAVMLERGPGNASHGTFESTAFYYLDKPTAVTLAADRTPPKDPFAPYTLMGELANLERLDDYAGASEAIDQWLVAHNRPAIEPILRLRQIAYIERLEGIEKARPLYEQFIAETASTVAKQYAKQLLWFHESQNHALLTFYAKNPSRLSLDGKPMLIGGNPQRLSVKQVVLEPGSHALSLETQRSGYPDWVQACLRTHNGLISTGSDWEFTFNNEQWYFVNDVQMEGPPAAPQVAMDAHPFVDMHSKALAIWISEEWPASARQVLFRKVFEIP